MRMSYGREILLNLFDQFAEVRRSFQDGKGIVSGRVETFLEREAFLQQLEGGKRFAKRGVGGGQKIENGATIGSFSEETFGQGDLRADFGGIRGFRGSAAGFFLFLSCAGGNSTKREQQQGSETNGKLPKWNV